MQTNPYKVAPLTVYKASAGSGKTFTLAVEYIKLLICDPKAYESTLAVTFTNKATEEMKSRILSQLYGIANKLEDSHDYMEKVCGELHVSEDYAAQRASEALYNLLHNYNFFRVQTIDTFFQSVVRNLAKELQLSNNLRITINDEQVISQAVDSVMESLGEDKELMSWVFEYVNDSMDDEHTWNVTDDIKSFGANLTKEYFKRNKGKLKDVFADPVFFDRYKKKMTEIKNEIPNKYIAVGKLFFEHLKKNGLTVEDFTGKSSGPVSYFIKLRDGFFSDTQKEIVTKTTRKAMTDNTGWCKKDSPKHAVIEALATDVLIPLFNETEKTRRTDSYRYNSAVHSLRNMNKLRLLHAIETEIVRQNGIHSRFMLSDTQTTLNDLMRNDEKVAPFIYEKIGSRIKHIMIDEFQDTSNVQWKNFRILLEETMSQPEFKADDDRKVTNNLIVGDVKQSIYRFRSGDWRLLNDIKGGNTGFEADKVFDTSLSTNFRSQRNIIDFNNLFFYLASSLEVNRIMPDDAASIDPEFAAKKKEWAYDLKRAYCDVCQNVPEDKPKAGYVDVKLLYKDDIESILSMLVDNITRLLELNVKQKDIAILVRGKKEISIIAEHFAQYPDLRLVSEEAFRLDSSPAIKMIICAMKMVAGVDYDVNVVSLAKLYNEHVKKLEAEDTLDSLFVTKEHISDLLPDDLFDEEYCVHLKSMPLSELAETLVRILSLSTIPGQAIYVSTLFDKLMAFVTDNAASLTEFIEYWEEELYKKTVSIGEVDGIRILSIHKSKGLEFKHLMVPFSNWHLLPPCAETLWCETKTKPFSELPFIPVDYYGENTFRDSVYEIHGGEEYMQEIVDNLNLLYVAFTRAEKSLFVMGGMTISVKEGIRSKDYRSTLIEGTLELMSSMKEPLELPDGRMLAPLEGVRFRPVTPESPLEFSYGELIAEEADTTDRGGDAGRSSQESREEKNAFKRRSENLDVTFNSYDNAAVQFMQSNESSDFADDIVDDDDSRRYIHYGTIMHQAFSRIQTVNDVLPVVRQLEFDGLLCAEHLSAQDLRDQLICKFENPQVADWFSPRWRVFNECTIIHESEGIAKEDRPDRVITDGKNTIVIDFKFGKEQPEKYKGQVRRYMSRLIRLGMPKVSGFLWYVNQDEIVPVTFAERK